MTVTTRPMTASTFPTRTHSVSGPTFTTAFPRLWTSQASSQPRSSVQAIAFMSCCTTCSNVWQSQLWRMVIHGGARAPSVRSTCSTSGASAGRFTGSPRRPDGGGTQHPAGSQAGDGGGGGAEDVAQDGVGGLAELRRAPGVAHLTLGSDGASHLLEGPELRVRDFHNHIARSHLLVGQGLPHVVDGGTGHAAPQPIQPVRGPARRAAP